MVPAPCYLTQRWRDVEAVHLVLVPRRYYRCSIRPHIPSTHGPLLAVTLASKMINSFQAITTVTALLVVRLDPLAGPDPPLFTSGYDVSI